MIEHIKEAQSIIDALRQMDAAGLLVLAVLIITPTIIKISQLLISHQNNKKVHKQKIISDFLASQQNQPDNLYSVVKDLHEADIFKVATGIHAEKLAREHLMLFHTKNSYNITWQDIRAATPYFEFTKNGVLTLKEQTIFDRIWMIYTIVIAYSLATFFAIFLIFGIIYFKASIASAIGMFAMSMVSLLISGFAFNDLKSSKLAEKFISLQNQA